MGELDELQLAVVKFRDKRDWIQYHTPKNLAMAICSEAGELTDLYLWDRHPEHINVGQEMADILIYLLSLADVTGINLYQEVIYKLHLNSAKYPINKFKGSCEKSNEIHE
jgi:dCTP diphosphatase